MSKLSFRARALDTSKPISVYRAADIVDLTDVTAINRAVPLLPTGMEREEEKEHHLQQVLSAQQLAGVVEDIFIPVPEVDDVTKHYEQLYKAPDFKLNKQYIHVQSWSIDQEIPDYDMDSEDEGWLSKQSKKLECSSIKFETMMDRLEKGSGQMVMQLQEAKALLKEDDDLIIAVYDYWLNKRLRLQHPLIAQVKTDKRDGTASSNPYVAFRRRAEKMQTRKNRKNDEASYEKMLKLRRDLNKALTMLELMKRREKSKKELVQLALEIVDKRFRMADWDERCLQDALSQQHKMPSFLPVLTQYNTDWADVGDVSYVRKKREYKKRKLKLPDQRMQPSMPIASRPLTLQQHGGVPSYTSLADVSTPVATPVTAYSSDEENLSPTSCSDQEMDDDPDGVYAFRRQPGVDYLTFIDGLGNWPWCSREEGGFADSRYRYSLASLGQPRRRALGFVRRRCGRGGRVLLDRATSQWDECLHELDGSGGHSAPTWAHTYHSYISDNKMSYFHPRPFSGDDLQTVAVSDDSMLSVTLPVMSLSTETSYLNHQRNLGSLFNGCHSSYVTNCEDQFSESEDKESLKLQALDSGLVTLATSAVSQSENNETPNGLEMMDVTGTDLLDHLTTPTIAAPGYRTLAMSAAQVVPSAVQPVASVVSSSLQAAIKRSSSSTSSLLDSLAVQQPQPIIRSEGVTAATAALY